MSDEEYHRALKKFVQDVRSALSIKKSFERLVQVARRTGLTDLQIGDDIRAEFKGELPDVTIRKYLPASFKHQEFSNKPEAIRVSPKPQIPPPPQVVREAETVTQSFVPQTQPQPEVNTDPILDCRKFGMELRMGLLNNSKLRLKINRLNEVIEIQ